MKIPEPENHLVVAIDSAVAATPQAPRPHFGISQIGQPCKRRQWLAFRWAFKEKFEGRMLRLFRRGQLEEAVAVEYLRAAGLDVREVGSNQRRVSLGGHVSGSVDGIIYGGVPGAEKSQHLLEIKTHSKKSFDDLERNGVEKSKPEHYAQMQGYMLATGIDRALYYAVCKDDDALHIERVKLDREYAEKLRAEAVETSQADNTPPPISTNPSWYQCKFCPAWDLCHGSKLTREANCRTCAHSTAKPDGSWHCARWEKTLSIEEQRDGCKSHVLHPDMVPWQLDVEKSSEWCACYDGVFNGEGGVESKDLCS